MPHKLMRQTTGHSLIELLGALALTTIGVIGLTHIQHWREASELELLARIQASTFAHNMLRRIEINPDGLTAYRTTYDSPPSSDTRCRHSACPPEQLARSHVTRWKCRLGQWVHNPICRDAPTSLALLPAGDGQITVSNKSIAIAIRWLGANQQLQSFELSSPLMGR